MVSGAFPTIFVSVASYNDVAMGFTLEEIFKKAKHPSRIRVGLVDQSHQLVRQWLSERMFHRQVRLIKIDPLDSRGACWARYLAQSLYDGEDYYLQVDSHTMFKEGWDELLIDQYLVLKQVCEKPIISTYPPAFSFDQSGNPFVMHADSGHIHFMRPNKAEKFDEFSVTQRFDVSYVAEGDIAEGYHIGGNFLFADGQFVIDVPYDFRLYFHGEEQNLALRAYCSKWKIFQHKQGLIPVFHMYKQPNVNYESQHWDVNIQLTRAFNVQDLMDRATKRLLDLVDGAIESGLFDLKNRGMMEDFIKLSGLDYKLKRIGSDYLQRSEGKSMVLGDQSKLIYFSEL